MPVQKQNISINFSQGLDTKTDPFQVPIGKFQTLTNSIFLKGGRLTKRNGYGQLSTLPDTSSTLLTTFNGDLTAVGVELNALSSSVDRFFNKGAIQPLELSTLPLIRNNTNQTQLDVAVSNNLICTVYTDQDPASLGASIYRYAIADATTGQNFVAPTTITGADVTYGTPRVFVLGNYFVILYTGKVATTYHLYYIAVNTSSFVATTQVSITASYTPATTVAFDGIVFNNTLYIAWNGGSASGIKVTSLSSLLTLGITVNPDASHAATLMSLAVDEARSLIWVSYYNLSATSAYTFAISPNFTVIVNPAIIIGSGTVLNLTSVAVGGILTFLYEVSNAYSYDSGIPSHYININTCTLAGFVPAPSTLLRSVGLASKAVLFDNVPVVLTTYKSPYQNTYFLVNGSGNILAKLAYENGGGYLVLGLPNLLLNGDILSTGYLIKDLIEAVNKNTNVPTGSQTAGIYSQTGINLVNFTFSSSNILSAEVGNNLNITGGFLWAYDGYAPTEQGFFVYPDSIEATWSATGGSIAAKPDGSTNANAYFYQVTYEWTDQQGNAFRSAPSIPISVTTAGSGTAGSITVNIPMLRLTYKTANPVKIVVYRWSVAQQNYYQTTSITAPVLNSITSDSVAFVDTNADATILGNNLLYTTGGVVEDIGAPSFSSVFIFDDRLFGITSEDPNLLWYSKQVIESTPVEMSDLFTIYVAPNIGAQGNTGPLLCGSAMDDKAILFKASAINYFNGTGPDITGANNQYSPPVFITSTVGCSNQKSIVFQPQGLMFEFASEAGNQIWLLGRDLSTQYIGAPVESLTSNATVQSAVNIPGTNQVRFTLSSGITLMYDYYYGQWGSFSGVPAISSCLYQGLHTYLNGFGQVFQETPGSYLDGDQPVLMSFTTSWINFNQLQGYQRVHSFYLLGTYISPHKLQMQISYDYVPSVFQQTTINPTNFAGTYGQDLTYGQDGTVYGGPATLENWRIFMQQQRCQSFQLNIQELYDASYGVVAGAGLTLSGINCIVGFKKGYRPIRASQSVG